MIGQIFLAIIAIAVTVMLPGGGIIGGAINGAIGSIVSQTVGVATGIQEKFSWKSVALAFISVGVGGGVSQVMGPAQSMAGAALRGAASSAVSQGIGVALGLQDKFSWAAVAAAGVGAGIGHAVGGTQFAKSLTAKSEIAGDLYVGMADAMGQAATLSLIQGSDFGDNLIASLPSVLGGAIGRQIGGRSVRHSPKLQSQLLWRARPKLRWSGWLFAGSHWRFRTSQHFWIWFSEVNLINLQQR